jgi:short-subunit dehydrogenase
VEAGGLTMGRANKNEGLAVVTGASAGIGAEMALQLSRRGRPVLAIARREDKLRQLAERAREHGGAPVHVLPLDVTLPHAAAAVRDRARELGGAAWLVNNAGLMEVGPVQKGEAARQAAQVRLNCEAPVALCAAIVPDLVARGAGAVLNVASLAGMQPTPFFAAYGASKAFVISYSEALSEELRGTGVTVTALCPGPVATELVELPHRRSPSYELGAAEAARAGIEGTERGVVIAIPGARNRLQALAPRLAPRALVRRIARRTALVYNGFDPDKWGAG